MNEFKMQGRCKFFAFTLAEMMIVLLIMTIILAVMAPVVTTRMRDGGSGGGSVLSPWLWTNEDQRRDAYLASTDINSTRAAIGFRKNNIPNEGDNKSRLILNATSQVPNNLSFYRDGIYVGRLAIDTNQNLLITNIDSDVNIGNYNTVIGMRNDGAGDNSLNAFNVALGYRALRQISNRTHHNVAIGANSLFELDDGMYNVAIGRQANWKINCSNAKECTPIYPNLGVAGSIAIGFQTKAQPGAIAIGTSYKGIGGAEANDIDSIAIGARALASASRTIAIGGYSDTGGSTYRAQAIGDNAIALGNSKAYKNSVAIGYSAQGGSDNTDNLNSVAIGSGAKATKMRTVAVGPGATATADSAYAMGYAAKVTAGNAYAMGANATASGEEAYAMGYNTQAKGPHSIAIGNDKKIGSSGTSQYTTAYTTQSIAIGSGAITGDSGLNLNYVGDSYQIAIGYMAQAYQGSSIAIGANAVASKSTDSHLSSNIAIGANSEATADASIAIGRHAKVDKIRSTAIGYAAYNNEDKTILLGCDPTITGTYTNCNGNMQKVKIPSSLEVKGGITGTVSAPSDSRLKHIGSEYKAGLDKIKQLKPFNYTFKKDAEKTPRVGVIAQDLQKIFPDAVKKGSDGFFTVRMEDMFYAVVNAVKELDQRLAKLEASVVEILRSVKENKDTIKQLQKDNERLQKENNELKARLDRIEAKLK